MKKVISIIFLLAVSATLTVSAQKFEPNTRWPYLYEEFTHGTIFLDGNTKSESDLNIHLLGNVLHYIGTDGKIYQSDDKNVIRVEIGPDAYLFNDHKLMKILATEGTSVLVKLTSGDFNSMLSGSGAYGASLNSSATRDLSSLDLGGLENPDLGLLEQQRYEGSAIPLIDSYYFIIGGQQVEATKKGIDKFLGDSRADELKKFLKDNKIKWKNAESLATLLQFLAK